MLPVQRGMALAVGAGVRKLRRGFQGARLPAVDATGHAVAAHPIGARLGMVAGAGPGSSSWCRARKPDCRCNGTCRCRASNRRTVGQVSRGGTLFGVGVGARKLRPGDATGAVPPCQVQAPRRRGVVAPLPTCCRTNRLNRPWVMVNYLPNPCREKPDITFRVGFKMSRQWKHGGLDGRRSRSLARRRLPRKTQGRPAPARTRNSADKPAARVVQAALSLETRRGLHNAGKAVSVRSRVARRSCAPPNRSRSARCISQTGRSTPRQLSPAQCRHASPE